MLLKVAIRNITRNKRRSFVTMATVAVGTASLFLFSAFNLGIMNQYRNNAVHARYGYGQINTVGYRDQAFAKPWEHWISNPEELSKTIRKNAGVLEIFPRIELYTMMTKGDISVSGKGMGIVGEREAPFFNTMNYIEGGAFTTETDGLTLGVGIAKALGVHPGDMVTVAAKSIDNTMGQTQLKVTGIFHMGTREIDDSFFQMPLVKVQEILHTDKIETIALSLKTFEDFDSIQKDVVDQYPNLEVVPFAILDTVYYQHAVDWLASQYDFIRMIILAMVLLGIFNTASSSILERTKEIGTLRANGESIIDVLRLLLYEALVIALTGACCGLAYVLLIHHTLLRNGILMPPSPGLTRQFYVLLEPNISIAISAFILCVVTASTAAVIAGLKVARMPISVALRSY